MWVGGGTLAVDSVAQCLQQKECKRFREVAKKKTAKQKHKTEVF